MTPRVRDAVTWLAPASLVWIALAAALVAACSSSSSSTSPASSPRSTVVHLASLGGSRP